MTSVQDRGEPRASDEGASVDQIEVRNGIDPPWCICLEGGRAAPASTGHGHLGMEQQPSISLAPELSRKWGPRYGESCQAETVF